MPTIGQIVQFFTPFGGDSTHPEAAIVTAVLGERVNLVHWSAAGVQQARHDVMQCKEPTAGCWRPIPSEERRK